MNLPAAKPSEEPVPASESRFTVFPSGEADAPETAINSAGPPPPIVTTGDDTGGDSPSWPNSIGGAALQGIVGEVVRAIEPHTESDPAAILIQFLVGFGNAIGKGPRILVDGHQHAANLDAVIVGDTSRARKGTSWRRVREVLAVSDPEWASDRITNGLSSGEGLIYAVRDPVTRIDDETGKTVIVDAGVKDKRLLIVESEFGGALRVIGREGNTLSAILRQAYDGDTLRVMTKNNPSVATAPHVSLCGHITREELDRHLSSVEAFNGLGNRILWACARRSKLLPFGGNACAQVMQSLGKRLADIANDARQAHGIRWASTGMARWGAAYTDLTVANPGLLGAVTSRAEAHTLRLAMIFALLDKSREIADTHVDAALDVWRYCADSASLLFGRSSGDGKADAVLAALKRNPDGLTRTQISTCVFNRHERSDSITRILDSLTKAGSVRLQKSPTGGRSSDRFFAA